MMQILTVRQVPDEVHRALKARATRAGRSVEAEVRQILAETCLPASGSARWLDGLSERARQRTGNAPQTDSVTLVREGRDARSF